MSKLEEKFKEIIYPHTITSTERVNSMGNDMILKKSGLAPASQSEV